MNMAHDAQTRVQNAIHHLIKDLDVSCLRKMQAEMHRCAAKCCDDTTISMEATHECVTKCSKSLNKTQTYIEEELTSYQKRLETCVLQCQYDVKDQIGPDTKESQINSFTQLFEKCVIKCADNHIDMIPNMSKKMKDVINK